MIRVKMRSNQWVHQTCPNHEGVLENELIRVRTRKETLDSLSTGCEEHIASGRRT